MLILILILVFGSAALQSVKKVTGRQAGFRVVCKRLDGDK